MSQHFHVNCKFLGCWREFGANEYDGVAADWFATDSQKSIRTENESLFWRVLKTTCGHLTNRWFAAHGDFLRTSIFLCHIHFFYIYYIYYSLLSFFVLNICYIYHIYYHLCTTIYYNDDHLLLSSIIITIIIYYYHLFPLLGIQWWFTSTGGPIHKDVPVGSHQALGLPVRLPRSCVPCGVRRSPMGWFHITCGGFLKWVWINTY
jgi:hypothetical protein